MELIEQREFAERYEELVLKETTINLLLNPNEPDHAALLQTNHKAIEKIGAGDEREKRTGIQELSMALVSQSQAILKREWKRVKTGE